MFSCHIYVGNRLKAEINAPGPRGPLNSIFVVDCCFKHLEDCANNVPHMKRLLLPPLALVALAIGASTAAANTAHDRAVLRRERIAVQLINEATHRVQHAHRACRPSLRVDPRPTFTTAKPSDALLGTLGVLRRPATDADRVDTTSLLFPFARGIYENWIRTATASDRRQFSVIVAQDRLRPRGIPQSCLALEDGVLRRLLVHRGPAVATVALRLKRRLDREEHPKGGFKPAEAIFLFQRTADGRIGSGGGGVDLAYFVRHGLFASSGTGSRSTVSGLLPDGVARVDFTFARSVSRGPHRDPKVYPMGIALSAEVQDNVVSFDVDRPAEDAFPAQMVWRRADGSVIRIIGHAGS